MEAIFPRNPFASPDILTIFVMIVWPIVVLYLFNEIQAQKAAAISLITAWLFLPEVALILPGLPDYNKVTATCVGILLATLWFQTKRLNLLKFGWVDIPMLIWCLCPFASSVTNGLGWYDGISAVLDQSVRWGFPYLIGRLYFNNLAGLRHLATGIFVGGLVYVPLCLFEIRMSPQLHRLVYGALANSNFTQTVRYGGFRPTVFLEHGLAVGAWMMAATLTGFWLWKTKAVKRLWGIPIEWLLLALILTLILCKSTGTYVLMTLGVSILFISRKYKTFLPVLLIVISVIVYLYISAETENYVADQLIHYLSSIFPPDRIQSLEFRFNNEELLVDHARERIIFGWGGWGRSLVQVNAWGKMTIQDSLWVIAFGENGRVGLVSLMASMLLPPLSLLMRHCPPSKWSNKSMAPLAVLSVMIILYMVDSLMNAMVNPIYIAACGGLGGIVVHGISKNRSAFNPRGNLKVRGLRLGSRI